MSEKFTNVKANDVSTSQCFLETRLQEHIPDSTPVYLNFKTYTVTEEVGVLDGPLNWHSMNFQYGLSDIRLDYD